MTFSHPTTLSRTKAELASRFVDVVTRAAADARWHFRVSVPASAKAAPASVEAPTAATPLVTLGLFYAGSAELEVLGHALVREVDPADFLEVWLTSQGVAIQSSLEVATDGGVAGDVVATWRVKDADWAGRYYAVKYGDRLFILSLRAPAADYERYAETFLVAMTTFDALSKEGSILAEDASPQGEALPVPWKLLVPHSWLVQPDCCREDLTSFRATQMPLENSATELLFGKCIFGLASPKVAKSPAALVEAFVEALEDKGVAVEPAAFSAIAARAPFARAHSLVARATYDRAPFHAIPCEVRFNVFEHKRASFFAGVFGPSRETGAIAWMQNKRALDVMAMTLDVTLDQKGRS